MFDPARKSHSGVQKKGQWGDTSAYILSGDPNVSFDKAFADERCR